MLHLVMLATAPLLAAPRPVDLKLAAVLGSVAVERPLQPLGYRPDTGRGTVTFRLHGSGEALHGTLHGEKAHLGMAGTARNERCYQAPGRERLLDGRLGAAHRLQPSNRNRKGR